MPFVSARALAVAAASLATVAASAQLRVATWNISFYGGGRIADIQAAVYGVFQGRSMAPDVLLGQEFLSDAALQDMRTALNTAPGSPGDWVAAPFIDGPDTESVCLYRSSKVDFLGVVIASTGAGVSTEPPRNTYRYDFRLKGYNAEAASISMYSSHMKSGSASSDQARRLIEAQRIRANAAALPPGRHFLFGGDTNIQSSGQAAYQALVGSPGNPGQFFDPIFSPGTWNNSGSFVFVHTQDPIGAGGMDDRHDQVLISAGLLDGRGFDYIGNPVPYSTSTWNDTNHTYRSWGNDGTSFNTSLAVTNNAMVGPAIAQALINCAAGAGHLPVFLDLRVPAKVQATSTVDFGPVVLGRTSTRQVQVSNGGNVALWTASGIAPLSYSFNAPAGVSAPAGTFTGPAGAAASSHDLVFTASGPLGAVSNVVTLASNDVDAPSVGIVYTARVVPQGDTDLDGRVNFVDLNAVLTGFGSVAQPGQTLPGDVTFDGVVNFADLNLVLTNFGQGV